MAGNTTLPRRLPTGRPRLTVQAITYRELKRRSPANPAMCRLTQVVRALIEKACHGDVRAASLLFDRMDGKAVALVAHARIDELQADPLARAAQAASLVDQLRGALGVQQQGPAPDGREIIDASPPTLQIGEGLGAPADLMPGVIPNSGKPVDNPPQGDGVRYPMPRE